VEPTRDRTGDLLLAKLGGTFSTRCHTLPKPEITAKSALDVCHTLPSFAVSACSLLVPSTGGPARSRKDKVLTVRGDYRWHRRFPALNEQCEAVALKLPHRPAQCAERAATSCMFVPSTG
jgi:hypothetical protein